MAFLQVVQNCFFFYSTCAREAGLPSLEAARWVELGSATSSSSRITFSYCSSTVEARPYILFTRKFTTMGSTLITGFENHKKYHTTLRAKRATFTFWMHKSSLKMPKLVHYGEILKTWSLRSNSVTRQAENAKSQKFKWDILNNFLLDFLIFESSDPTVVRRSTCFVGTRWILLRRGVSWFAHDGGEDRGSVLLWRHCLVRTRLLSRQPLQPLSLLTCPHYIHHRIQDSLPPCRLSNQHWGGFSYLPKQDGGCNQTLSPLATNKLIKPHPPQLKHLKDR